MNKGKRNRYDAKKAEVVKYVAKQFGVTEGYVRMCITGVANTGQSDDIRCAFNQKYAQLKALLS